MHSKCDHFSTPPLPPQQSKLPFSLIRVPVFLCSHCCLLTASGVCLQLGLVALRTVKPLPASCLESKAGLAIFGFSAGKCLSSEGTEVSPTWVWEGARKDPEWTRVFLFYPKPVDPLRRFFFRLGTPWVFWMSLDSRRNSRGLRMFWGSPLRAWKKRNSPPCPPAPTEPLSSQAVACSPCPRWGVVLIWKP